jgi:hypothetical protein
MNNRQLAQKWPFPRHKEFKQKLQHASTAWFKDRQFETHPKMPYCLLKWSDWGNNIILKEVREYIQKCKAESENQGKPFPLHQYIHHGLSSQAMTFNLIVKNFKGRIFNCQLNSLAKVRDVIHKKVGR